LLLNQLYFASPVEINDPFDFKTTHDYTLLDTDDKRERYVDKLIEQTIEILHQRGIDPQAKKAELMWRLANELEKIQDEYDSTSHPMTDNRFGVLSLSTKWDSVLMWSHYAVNHQGFCIGYDFEKLKCYNRGTAGPVSYRDTYPALDPLDPDPLNEILTKTHTKAAVWTYEDEYRFTRLWENGNPTIDDRILTIPNECISEVILGININPSDQKEIVTTIAQKGISLYQAIRKRRSYGIDRVQLFRSH
jgi:hypothetical protein